jgi:hypothetical protein
LPVVNHAGRLCVGVWVGQVHASEVRVGLWVDVDLPEAVGVIETDAVVGEAITARFSEGDLVHRVHDLGAKVSEMLLC